MKTGVVTRRNTRLELRVNLPDTLIPLASRRVGCENQRIRVLLASEEVKTKRGRPMRPKNLPMDVPWTSADEFMANTMKEILDGVDLSTAGRFYVQQLRDGKSYVYFIGGEDTPIKIGFSAAPYERLAALQTAHWAKLSILAKVEGTFDVEDAYHVRFAAHRLHGEWFTRCPEIEAEIARLACTSSSIRAG